VLIKYLIAILALPALVTLWFLLLRLSKKHVPEKYEKMMDDCEEETEKKGCGFCAISDDCGKAKL